MIIKTIRFLIFNVSVLVCISVAASAVRNQQIYPLPETEAEDVVIQWLQGMGYHLRRSTISNHGVLLYAQKGSRSWQITLWPNSPLATRVHAKYTFNKMADPSQLEHLWSLLGNHMKTIMDQAPEDHQPIPAAILSKTESVVCIHVGYPEKYMQISGFIIDTKGLIVCTAHGLENIQQPVTVALHDGRELPGRVIKMDKQYDLSMVDVNTELDTGINLSSGRDLMGDTERLYNVVCKANSNGPIFSGIIGGPPRKADNQLLWQINMQIRPGSSGSPVFDHQGNLVAVVKGRYRGGDKVGFLIPFASLMNFLKE